MRLFLTTDGFPDVEKNNTSFDFETRLVATTKNTLHTLKHGSLHMLLFWTKSVLD